MHVIFRIERHHNSRRLPGFIRQEYGLFSQTMLPVKLPVKLGAHLDGQLRKAAVVDRANGEGRGADDEGEARARVGVHVRERSAQGGRPDAQVVWPSRWQGAPILLIQLWLIVWQHTCLGHKDTFSLLGREFCKSGPRQDTYVPLTQLRVIIMG